MKRDTQKELTLSASDFKVGDSVQVIERDATPDETKQRIFYNHMRGLTGTVRRVYEEEKEIWVEVDQTSLPDAVRQRHGETEDQMRQKWLDGLSDEARRKLKNEETKFSLRYSILTTPNHLIRLREGEGLPSSDSASSETAATPQRKSLDDLNAQEQQFLDRAMENRQQKE